MPLTSAPLLFKKEELMRHKEFRKLLNDTTVKDMPMVFIPSYNRPNIVVASKVLTHFTEEALERVFIVVREEQYKEYKRANPHLQFVQIPAGTVNGVGSTRQFIMDYAKSKRYPVIMDMDDDIKYLQYLFTGESAKGETVSLHTGIRHWAKDPLIPQKVLQMAGHLARECFEKYPQVLLGNIRKQRFSNHRELAEVKYYINKGPTPRQTKIINMRGVAKAGIRMPDEFNLHGDDIGFAAEVLQRGYSCFNIPCLCYDYVDDQVASVVRDPKNPEKNRWLHKLEYDALQGMEIKNYLKQTFSFPDGQYKFGDINWMQYHAYHKTEPIIERW